MEARHAEADGTAQSRIKELKLSALSRVQQLKQALVQDRQWKQELEPQLAKQREEQDRMKTALICA